MVVVVVVVVVWRGPAGGRGGQRRHVSGRACSVDRVGVLGRLVDGRPRRALRSGLGGGRVAVVERRREVDGPSRCSIVARVGCGVGRAGRRYQFSDARQPANLAGRRHSVGRRVETARGQRAGEQWRATGRAEILNEVTEAGGLAASKFEVAQEGEGERASDGRA